VKEPSEIREAQKWPETNCPDSTKTLVETFFLGANEVNKAEEYKV